MSKPTLVLTPARTSRRIAPRLLATLVSAAWVSALALLPVTAHAQLDEAQARALADDLKVFISEGTGVIGDLQAAINGSKTTKEQVATDSLVEAFFKRYEKAAGRAFDTKAAGAAGDARRAYLASFKDVVTRHQPQLIKGGQDALVPAFFRAQVLKGFNTAMTGKVQAYATNREQELINSDWGVKGVMKHSPLAADVSALMQTGGLDAVTRRHGDRLMGYWPMKLAAGCVACHAQNGLKQEEGKFGGALVAEVMIK